MSVLDRLRETIERASPSAFGENKRAVLFGTTDSGAAALQVARFVERVLDTRIADIMFVRMASACAAGLMLSDGRKVFLKVHAGEFSLEELTVLHRTQDLLREQGIPAARLILPAVDFGNGKYASVHTFRDRGDRLKAYHRGAVEGAAVAFCRLMAIGRQLSAAPALPGMLVERPHPFTKSVLDLPKPPPLPGADRARAVVAAVTESAERAAGLQVIGHGDWASRNLRFSKGEVASIFDFEALVQGVEPVLVGQAAIQFINETSGVREPAAAAVQFVKCYEAAAGYPFKEEGAAAVDIGAALEVARFCRAAVRSSGMKDEEAPRIFSNFMQRFRASFARDYPKKGWTEV